MYNFIAKFLALFMSLVMTFSGISFSIPIFGLNESAEVEFDFTDGDELSAAGTYTVISKLSGNYELYWGDSDGDRLSADVGGYDVTYSEFAEVEVKKGTGETDVIPFTAIPDGAESVLVYKGDILCGTAKLPENKIHETQEAKYSFGALSDLHFNRYVGEKLDVAMLTFPNALNFLDACGVSLVAMSGDLSSGGERLAFEKFGRIASDYKFPVLTCTGNHDVSGSIDLESWQSNVNKGVYGENKIDGVKSVSDNGLDFVYAPDSLGGDVFIFFSQTAWSYNSAESRLVTDKQLDWLEAQLETYKNRRVYLFFHSFLANANGDSATGEGNLINSKGVTYDLVYTQGTPDEMRFISLLKQYKNVVFFNGHSHWQFAMQSFNPVLNITDYDGTYATLVHISSVTCPRTVKEKAKNRKEKWALKSEGYLIRVYDDCLVLTGVEFHDGEFLSYANYVVNK